MSNIENIIGFLSNEVTGLEIFSAFDFNGSSRIINSLVATVNLALIDEGDIPKEKIEIDLFVPSNISTVDAEGKMGQLISGILNYSGNVLSIYKEGIKLKEKLRCISCTVTIPSLPKENFYINGSPYSSSKLVFTKQPEYTQLKPVDSCKDISVYTGEKAMATVYGANISQPESLKDFNFSANGKNYTDCNWLELILGENSYIKKEQFF